MQRPGESVRDIVSLFVEVGLIVPIVAASKQVVALYALGLSLSIPAVVAMASGTLPVYLVDRLLVDGEDEGNPNKQTRKELIDSLRPLLWSLVIASLGVFFWLTWTRLSLVQFLLVQVHFGIFLCYPLLKRRRVFDTIGVTTAWALELVFVALFFSSAFVPMWRVVLVFTGLFVMKAAETELSNIRDIEGDLRAGNPTLASSLGVKQTRRVVVLGEIIGIGLLIVAWLGAGYAPLDLIVGWLGVVGVLVLPSAFYVQPERAAWVIALNRLAKILLAVVVVVTL